MTAEEKQTVYNLVILDESGSMDSIKPDVITGFNELVGNIKGIALNFPEQSHYVSLVTFNGLGIKELIWNKPAGLIRPIDAATYLPDSMTPLYDAMGTSILKLKNETKDMANVNVLVTILTDGQENHSREFTGSQIKHIIEELTNLNWTFTYIGSNHDVTKVAFDLSISVSNAMHFESNKAEVDKMFQKERQARSNYAHNIRDKKNPKDNYFAEDKI